MRDELDGRLWVTHHDQFTQWVGDTLSALGSALRGRLAEFSDEARPLLMMVAAVGMTLLTFSASAA